MSSHRTGEATRTMRASGDEVRELARLAWQFCPLDERRQAGSVLLTDVLGVRSWLMGYSAGLVSYLASTATGDDDWVIPKRLVHAAAILGGDEVTFTEVEDDGLRSLTVASGTSAATLPLVHAPEFALLRLANETKEVAAHATLPVETLAKLVAAARWSPHNLDDDDRPPLFWIALDDGKLTISVDWGPFGRSSYSTRARGTGYAATAANPSQLADVLEVFEGNLTIEMTADPDDAMILRTSDRRALITPIETTFERFRASVEQILAQAFGDLVLRRDIDGDYPIRRHGAPIYARLLEDRPARLQVFAVLLDGVDDTPELYRELNELNTSVRFARLTWVSGQIHAEVDLIAETLDVDEVLVAVDRIERVSTEFIPTVGAFFGGTLPDAAASRWALYRSTVIEAEIVPGERFTLTGPDGVPNWSLPEEMFVLTGCNPSGTMSTDEANELANDELNYDIHRAGGRTVFAVGRELGGDHEEPAVLMWGLPLDAAVYFGRKYHQDVVFRLTAETMELISCTDDRRDSWPRLRDADEAGSP